MSKVSLTIKDNWFITLTDYGQDCPDDFVDRARVYLEGLEIALASVEKQGNGNDHVHALFVMKGQNGNIQRKFKKQVYNKKKTEKVPPNAMKLENVKHLDSVVAYIMKEVSDEEELLVRTGYKMTWIQEQCEKARKGKKVFTKWLYIKVDQVPGMMVDWLKSNNQKVTNKREFINCISQQEARGYNTRLWVKSISWIYAQVMRMQDGGDTGQSVSFWENALRFD